MEVADSQEGVREGPSDCPEANLRSGRPGGGEVPCDCAWAGFFVVFISTRSV